MENKTTDNGLFIRGRYLGLKEQSGVVQSTGQPYVRHSVGIEIPKENGFPGETIVLECRLSKDLMNNGITRSLESLLNKEVQVSVWVSAFATRSGAGFSYNVSNNLQAIRGINQSAKAA